MEKGYINKQLLISCHRFMEELNIRMGTIPPYTSFKKYFFTYNHWCTIENKSIVLNLIVNYESTQWIMNILHGNAYNPYNFNFSNNYDVTFKKVNHNHWKFIIKLYLNNYDIRNIKLNYLIHEK